MKTAVHLDDPQPLPSLPSSPAATIQEDFCEDAHVTTKHEEQSDPETTPTKTRHKGKSREVFDDSQAMSESDDVQVSDVYPPTQEDEAETRRVQENLRRWEMAERRRRKTARESYQQPVKSSLVNGVARRASLLWTGRKSQHDSRPSRNDRGLGNHAALQSRDSVDVVPLGSLETAGVDTPSTSPLTIQHDVNPFNHPSDSISSFVNQPAVMDVSSNPPTFSTQIDDTKQLTAKRRSLVQSSSRKPPTPKPLHLPSPCTPPPPNGQLQPTPSPSISPPPNDGEGEPRSTRWWHDWLCGCSEGDDRGGDDQAGKTNPME